MSFWSRGCLLVGEHYACRWQLVVAESARSFGVLSDWLRVTWFVSCVSCNLFSCYYSVVSDVQG